MATSSLNLFFHHLDGRDQPFWSVQPDAAPAPVAVSRVSMRPHDPQTGQELDQGEVAHGYEIERGRYVTLTNEELKALAQT